MQLTAAYERVADGYAASLDELPGVTAQGNTLESARCNLLAALKREFEKNGKAAENEERRGTVIRERLEERPSWNYQKYGNLSQIASAVVAAAGIFWIVLQIGNAGEQLSYQSAQARFQFVTSYAKATADCQPRGAGTDSEASAQADLWNSLCKARVLSNEIVVYDFLKKQGNKDSLINLNSADGLTIQLEDALLRELLVQANAVLLSARQCRYSTGQLYSLRQMLVDVYMLDHPSDTFDGEKKLHAKKSDHEKAFWDFVQAVAAIGAACTKPASP